MSQISSDLVRVGQRVLGGSASTLLGTGSTGLLANITPADPLLVSGANLYYNRSSYGQGADISNVDSAHFSWFQTNIYRNGSLNVRTSHFNASETIMMIAYADNGIMASGGSMTILEVLDDGTGLPGVASYFLEVTFDGDHWALGSSFNQVPFDTLAGFTIYDPGANWDGSNYWYTVPSSGIYQVVTKLRIQDSSQ